MRKFGFILLIAVAAVLSGCGGNSGIRNYAWVIATASPANTVTGIFAETFAQKVNEFSDGQMKVQVFHNSVLGGDTELIESCQCGDIPFVVQNTAPEVSYMPRLCLFDLPCVFSNLTSLHKVLDNDDFFVKINGIYEHSGFHLLAMADQNFRVMTSNKKIQDLSDFKGIKIRTMENSYHMDFWSSVGSNPTPMAFAELYVGLEQHTVDAQENPYEVICSNGFYEVQDYVIETNHLPHLLALVVNKDFYYGLNDTERVVVDKAASYARDYARSQALERAESRIAEITASGSQMVPVSEELHSEMVASSRHLYDKIRTIVADDELFEAYTSASSVEDGDDASNLE